MRNLTTFVLMLALLCASMAYAQESAHNDIYDKFLNPPSDARPQVWWHWMNGNITKDGIRKDLLWMKRSGIGGFHAFDGQLAMKQLVKRVAFMTPQWKDAFAYAVALGDSLDMDMTIPSCPGWSETGGPWVKAEDGMKRLSWRTMDINGGRKIREKLPEGFNNLGVFQDNHYDDSFEVLKNVTKNRLYKDIAVFAVRMPAQYVPLTDMRPVITTSGGAVTLEQLNNDGIDDFAMLSPDSDGNCWVQFEFATPQTIRSVTFCDETEKGGRNGITRKVMCSDDGNTFRTIDEMADQRCMMRTHNLPTTTARFFRFNFAYNENGKAGKIRLSTLRPATINTVEMSAVKSGFFTTSITNDTITPATTCPVRAQDVIDVTKHVKDGILTWNAPKGRWRILRVGYGLTGKANHPAVFEATGLEVDKLDPDAVTRFYDHLIKIYSDATHGMIGGKGITHILNDSYEAGQQTWTKNMLKEFRTRRGYDLTPWLPALTGLIIDSSEKTEQFLFDWRTTIGEMIAEYSYDLETKILQRYGLKRYSEAHGSGRSNLADGMDMKRYADIPMSEFWAHYKQGFKQKAVEEADIRESASVAHIYGKNIVAAESFTTDGFNQGAFVYCPSNLKSAADYAFACGLNRIVVHESALQPVDDIVPGIGLGRWGQWFNRHETWAEMAKAWTDYLARTSYMLQQGRFVADVAVYYGEDDNCTSVFHDYRAQVPPGYNYDYVNKSVLNNMVTVDNGDLVTASGMRYHVLQLNNTRHMSLQMLRRIAELADAGVTICGSRPQRMANQKGDINEFNALADKVWNSGRENVCDSPLSEVLRHKRIEPDVIWTPATDSIRYVHRKLDNGDIYWVSSICDEYRNITLSFRTKGKKPVIWHPETGATENAAYLMKEGRTTVNLSFVPHDAFFVMFLNDTKETRGEVSNTFNVCLANIDTPWHVAFEENRGAPADTTMTRLSALNLSETPGIKYFSGTSTYTTTFKWNAGKDGNGAKKLILDLGNVHDIAEVTVNGKAAGTLWHAPFTADVTALLRDGDNTLQVKVANVWHNRFIGDLQPGVEKKTAFYSKNFFTADEPLLPAGLTGPVRITGSF